MGRPSPLFPPCRRCHPRQLVGLGLLVLAALGVRSFERTWLGAGSSGAEQGDPGPGFRGVYLARLEADWERLAAWVAEPTPSSVFHDTPDVSGADSDTRRLPRPVDADTEALAALLRTWDEEPSSERTTVHLRGRAVLALLREHPHPDPLHPDLRAFDPGDLSDSIETVLGLQGLSADDLVHLAALRRRLQADHESLSFWCGVRILDRALDHVESDPARQDERAAALARLPAPQPDELFLALCRQTRAKDARLSGVPASAPDPSTIPTSGVPPHAVARVHRACAELGFTQQAYRRASLDRLLEVESLRDDPTRWAAVHSPKPITEEDHDRALLTRDPVGASRYYASVVDLNVQHRGPHWAELVERWDRLVGR